MGKEKRKSTATIPRMRAPLITVYEHDDAEVKFVVRHFIRAKECLTCISGYGIYYKRLSIFGGRMIMNLDRIHPCKRDKVRRGMEYIDGVNRDGKVIGKVVVFGSAVTDHCRDDSDIDLCLESAYPVTHDKFLDVFGNLEPVMGNLCDILESGCVGTRMRDEIASKGVIVYEY